MLIIYLLYFYLIYYILMGTRDTLSGYSLYTMRILIVEDDIDIAHFLKKSFEAESFAVDVMSDGEQGSYAARTNDYDIIILDNMLPKKKGLEVCRDIRTSTSRGKDVPIIMLSVKSEIPEKIALLNAGIDDYMTKPYSFEELFARTKAQIRRVHHRDGSSDGLVSEILHVGNLTINRATQEVKKGAKGIYLTRKEFALLELLVKNKGKVVSRGTIMEHVWDMDGDPLSRTIETHILNLRKKLGDTSRAKGARSHRLIFNVPGRGYKIADVPAQ